MSTHRRSHMQEAGTAHSAFRGWLWLIVLFCPLGAFPAAYAQDADEPSTREVIIENVDELEQFIEDGEVIRRLTGNVQLKQDSTYLQSNRALQYVERDEIFFYGEVLIVDQGDSLRADTVFYNRRSKVGEATGRVEFFDGEVRVLAPSGVHYADDKRTQFTEGVMLVDSLTTLTSWEGEYFSEEKRADFAHEVRLHRPWSYLESDSITYHRDTDISIARGDVLIERWEEPEDEAAPPDSVSRTLLLGDWAYSDEPSGVSRMDGRSLVMQLRFDEDSEEVDTLVMRSQRLEALEFDEQRRIIATGDVRSWRKDFASVADSVVYDRFEYHRGPIDDEEAPILLADASPPSAVSMAEYEASSEEAEAPGGVNPDTTTAPRSTEVEAALSTEEGGHANQELTPRDSLLLMPAIEPEAEDSLQQENDVLVQSDSLEAASEPLSAEEEGWMYPRLGQILEEYRIMPAEKHESRTEEHTIGEDRIEEDAAAEDTVEEVRLFRDPIAWFEQSQVSADSIRVLTDGSPVDSVFARGQVFIAQLDSLTERIHQLRGRNLAGTSVEDSVRLFAVGPNAEAIYHRTNDVDEPDGAVQALGDESFFRFLGEDLEYLHFTGGIEGYYYEEEHMPTTLQLSGYIWVPERRPDKEELLSEDPTQHDRIVRLLSTYPPLPDRIPQEPPRPGAALDHRPLQAPLPETEEEPVPEDTLTAPEIDLPAPPEQE